MSNIIELTNENFDATIGGSTLTLVDFNADWCGPCQMQAPILEELATEASEKTTETADSNYQIASLNVDDFPDLAAKYAVSSIPCMVLFQNGEEIERVIGLRPKKALEKILNKHLEN